MNGRPASPAALVLAAAPAAGSVKRGLEELLGPRGCAELQRVLVRRAARWASEAAPGAAYVALWRPDRQALDAGGDLDGADVERFAQAGDDLVARLGGAIAHVGERHRGPLLCACVDVPSLGPGHAAAALGDIGAGCDVVLGPSSDGGCYLLGLAVPELGPLEELLRGARRAEIVARGLTVAVTDRRVGLLRSERELHTVADAQAVVADPTAPREVVKALRR